MGDVTYALGNAAENMRTRDWLINYLRASYEGSETKFRIPGSYSETIFRKFNTLSYIYFYSYVIFKLLKLN